ncbi:MAG: HPr family phosphocarrier protein [Saccharofermentanales bacterium]|jgi:phosphotransferase system HPr (HPr) family protein
MLSRIVTFHCKEQTQMKAIAMLIQIASKFHSSLYITKDGRRANAKSMLGVLSLGINDGDEIELTANGVDGAEAIDALVAYMGEDDHDA